MVSSVMDIDPLSDNYLALFICIVWYRPITVDEAVRIIEGRSNMKKMCKAITPELERRIRKSVNNPGFSNMERLCKKFGISEADVRRIMRNDKTMNK